MDDPTRIVRDLMAASVRSGIATGEFLRGLCSTAARALSASGAAITVMTDDGTRGICAASDPLSERVEDLQFLTGEGPCIDAFATRRPVLIVDLEGGAARRRWPGYTAAVTQDGIRAVFAFPLQVGATRLGVLDVLRQRARPLTAGELALAVAFADLTVQVLLDRQHGAGNGLESLGGEVVDIGDRAELFQAQGMVMVQLGVSLGEAMSRIRAHAYAQNRPLHDVARDIVERRLHLDNE